MNKTQKEKYEGKKVYCLFNENGEKVLIGKVKVYLEKHHIKTALKNELKNELTYHKAMCEIYDKKVNKELVIKQHKEKYKKIKIVEYELKSTKEINCLDLLE